MLKHRMWYPWHQDFFRILPVLVLARLGGVTRGGDGWEGYPCPGLAGEREGGDIYCPDPGQARERESGG